MEAERVDGAIPTEQYVHRAGAHVGYQLRALGVGLATVVQLLEYPFPVFFLAEK